MEVKLEAHINLLSLYQIRITMPIDMWRPNVTYTNIINGTKYQASNQQLKEMHSADTKVTQN